MAFFWHDLISPSPDAAAAFYGSVFGWTDNSDGPLRTLQADGAPVAGLLRLRGDDNAPHWLCQLAVPDVAAIVRRYAFLQGAVLLEPEAVGDLGSGALVADPSGAILHPFQLAPGHAAAPAPQVRGHVLFAPRIDLAARFYSAGFGWKATRPATKPSTALLTDAGTPVALLVEAPAEAPIPPQWIPLLPGDDHTAVAALQAGGRLVVPPLDVPGFGRVQVLHDDQGAGFALIG